MKAEDWVITIMFAVIAAFVIVMQLSHTKKNNYPLYFKTADCYYSEEDLICGMSGFSSENE
jgi:hypothetical protein